MRPLDRFLKEEFAVEVDGQLYAEAMLGYVKKWPLNKPRGQVSWGQFNGAVSQLKLKCPWLKCRIYDRVIPCPGESQGRFA